jgi:hypothetical protein
MTKFTYTGTDEREFPSIAVTVKPGDTFDAPADFSANNVSAPKTTTKVGDE